MKRSRPLLELPAKVAFAGFNLEKRRWSKVGSNNDSLSARTGDYADRDLLLRYTRALLPAGVSNPLFAARNLSMHLARVINNSYRAGRDDGVRQSLIMQARKAQAAKKQKADARGVIIRRAITLVCKQQNLIPVASEKFAASIRSEVIEVSRHLGLTDVRAGTSTRSIRRHIAALVERGAKA